MMKMTKRICSLLFVAALLLAVAIVPAGAGVTTQPRVVDHADLLTDAQETEIASMLTEYSEKNNCDIVFLTESDLTRADFTFNGTAQDYADRYQETHGYDADTVLMFITLKDETGKRKIQFSCAGKCQKRLNDTETDEIIDHVFFSLQSSDYYTAMKQIATDISEKLPVQLKWYMLPLAIIIGFVIAMIIMSSIRSKLKTVALERGAVNYIRSGSMNVTAARDTYLYSSVSRTRRERENSSSRTSSGGVSHSGTGRNF